MENLKEPFGIAQVSNTINWKMNYPIVPKGVTVCKKIDTSENECPWYTSDTL